MNKLFFLLVLCISGISIAQTEVKKDLKTIETIEDAESYLEDKKSNKNKLLVFNEENHKTKLATSLFALPIGATKVVKDQFRSTHYKVISKTKKPHYRISYILLDANILKAAEILDLKRTILKKNKEAVPFEDLARRYSMDKNAKNGGDSGWFKDGEMPIQIENEVSNLDHDLNEIYTVSVPEDKAYYVIFKTHRIKTIKEISVLKVIEK